jgi:DNA-binding CsgD family transcriptional regulator
MTVGQREPEEMITADVVLPLPAIPPGDVLAETGTRLAVLRGVSVTGGSRQQFRLTASSEPETFEERTRAHPGVAELAALDRSACDPIYRIEWTERPPCPAIYRPDLLVERMGGTPDGWTFGVRAADGEALRSLQSGCRERDTEMYVHRLDQSDDGHDPYGVTDRQREVVMTAVEAGYFELPRETTLDELASELGISDQTVSEHLRRAQRNVLRHTLLDDADESARLG